MRTVIRTKITIIALLIAINCSSQNVGINATGALADPSAALDVVSSNKGLLVPRVALTALNNPLPIIAPLTSLMIYNTATAGVLPNNVVPGYYYWDGAKWVSLSGAISGGNNWNLLGNAGTTAGTNFLGTTDLNDLVVKTNSLERMRVLAGSGYVGVGTNAPTAPLDIHSNSNVTSQVITRFKRNGTNAGLTNGGIYIIEGASPGDWNSITANKDMGIYFDLDGNNTISSYTNGLVIAPWNAPVLGESGIKITEMGSVGIGTTSPGYQLDVVQPDGTKHAIASFANTNRDRRLEIIQDISTDPLQFVGLNVRENGSALGRDFIIQTGGTERMRINYTNGNVGIGTNAPAAMLHVGGSSSVPMVGIESTPSWPASIGGLTYDSWPYITGVGTAAVVGYHQNGGDMNNALTSSFTGFQANQWPINWTGGNGYGFRANVAAGTNRWAFYADNATSYFGGNVGVGNPLPINHKLQVVKDLGSNAVNYTLIGQHHLQFAVGKASDNKEIEIGMTDDGVGIIQSHEISVGYNALALNPVNGNVGIGTTVPNNKLEITTLVANTSGLRFTNLTSASPSSAANGKSLSVDVNGDVILVPSAVASAGTEWSLTGNAGTSAGTNFLGTIDLQDLVFKTNATEKMRVLTGGNVGIGTTTPGDKLEVNGRGQFLTTISDHALRLVADGTNAESKLQFTNNGASVEWGSIFGFGTGGGELQFSTASSPKMTITAGGNVGIGLPNPSYKLDVFGGAARIQENSTTGILGTLSLWGKNSTAVQPNIRAWNIYNMNEYAGLKGLVFWEYYDRNGNGALCDDLPIDCTPRMIIQNGDGHVGIGTYIPTSQLDISNADLSRTLNSMKNFNGIGNTDAAFIGGVDAGYSNTGVYILQKDALGFASPGTYLMNVVSNNVSQVVVNGAGQVGVGTTAPTPTSLLSVNGDADKIGGGAWSVFSDERVKHNINKYNKGLDAILKINPVSFQYNGKGGYKADGKTYVGIIAQEIEKVLPGTVSKVQTSDFEDQRLFNASELTFTLINAVKELQAQITSLKQENSDLKTSMAKLNDLEAKVELLLKINSKISNQTATK